MGMMWFIVGFIAGLSFFIYDQLWKMYPIDWKGWSGLVLGEVAVLFCIAWSVASWFEGEPQAAAMGLILFGGGGLVVLVLTWRFLILRPLAKAQG